MTSAELKKIATKIAKLLLLANSDNAYEAATAKRQAEALMEKYRLSQADIAASAIIEVESKTGGKRRAPNHIARLSSLIATAFACKVILANGNGFSDSLAIFLGFGIKSELASYTFDVLRRQLNKDRNAYKATLKRYKPANKTRLADIFCEGWLHKIYDQISEFAGINAAEDEAIDAYINKKYNILSPGKRKVPAPKTDKDYDAMRAGRKSAEGVNIRRPIQTKYHPKAITQQ